MNNPFFSVVICTYNQEQYIAQTLDSILKQKHDYPYEIIVGEDCSTDNTRKILLEYRKNFPAIIILLLNKHNVGMIQNYFTVVDNCKGKYIMVCAGDDYWLQGKVAFQISYMEEHPDVGMCYGKAKTYIDKNKKWGKNIGFDTTTVENLLRNNGIPALTVCMKADHKRRYITDIHPLSKNWLIEDLPMWFWFAQNSKIKYFDTYFAVYRVLTESVSHTHNIEKTESFIDSVIEIKKYFYNLYNYNHLNIDFDDDNVKILQMVSVIALNGEYERYKVYAEKIKMINIKACIKKIIGKNYLLFNLYRFYLKYI